MEFIDFLRQMDRVCENSDHCQNCPLKPFPCNDDIASIARNVDDQTLREMEDVGGCASTGCGGCRFDYWSKEVWE